MAKIELHAHPSFRRCTVEDVLGAMQKNDIQVAAIGAHNRDISDIWIAQAKQIPGVTHDHAGIMTPDGRYLLRMREHVHATGFHIVTVGYSQGCPADADISSIINACHADGGLAYIAHPFVDTIRTWTAGHIYEEVVPFLEEVCKTNSGKVGLGWNGYCIPAVRKWLKHALHLTGRYLFYHDVNERLLRFAEVLDEQGSNNPVLAVTDVHATRPKHLSALGTAHIKADITDCCPAAMLYDLRDRIFRGEYENSYGYVGVGHLASAYGFSIFLEKFRQRDGLSSRTH